ncbi:996_t:CDS:10, partial [Diversispora eburnea]
LMSEMFTHKYFDKKASEWNVLDFLDECEEERFDLMTNLYIKGLENIVNCERDYKRERAQMLLDNYKKASVEAFLLNVVINLSRSEGGTINGSVNNVNGNMTCGNFAAGPSNKRGEEEVDDSKEERASKKTRKDAKDRLTTPPPNPIFSESIEINSDSENDSESDTESIDIDQGEVEIEKLTQDEIHIRNKLLAILDAQQKKDIKSGKNFLTSVSLNHIIDLSNDKVQKEVDKSLNKDQIKWINGSRRSVPNLVRKSFVPSETFNSYNHEDYDIAQQILTHFSVRLEAPLRVEVESLNYERTFSIDTIIYIINRLFRMHQDVVDLVWIELTTPNTKKRKIDGLIKIINSIQKNQTIVLIEFSYGRRAPLSKIISDEKIARIYLIQTANGEIKIKYLVRPLPSIYILQLFTCIKIPVSFDEFEQFAKKITDLMNLQVDVLSTIQAMKEATTVENAIHITSIDDTPVKKKIAKSENQPLPSSCP